jgi:hypothetical protein
MSWWPMGLRDEQAKRGGRAGRGAAPYRLRELVAHKRPPVRAPLVFRPVTSAHLCGGRWSRPGALLEVTGVGGPPPGAASGVGRS